MTRENLVSNMSRYLGTCDGGLKDLPLSNLGADRFRRLTDTTLAPLFLHARQQLALDGVVAEPVVNLDHAPPYAMLWVKAPFRLILLWPSESRDWINFGVSQDRTLTEVTVSALSFSAITRGRLRQELDFALQEIQLFNLGMPEDN
jgi:hypothetical protein